MRFSDKVVVVTGATAGIGQEIARRFHAEGAKVALIGTNPERGEALVKDLSPNAVFYPCNVANTSESEETIKKILDHFGKIDVLVNNAGITRDGLFLKMSESDWDQVMATNVKSCYNLSRPCIRAMMRNRYGRIVNITSVVGLTGNIGQANYAASKAAMVGLTKSIAQEYASRGITANCVAPGFIETRMTAEMTPAAREVTLTKIPLGRMGTPSEIASSVLFLASDEASYITGQTLTVDGGMVM